MTTNHLIFRILRWSMRPRMQTFGITMGDSHIHSVLHLRHVFHSVISHLRLISDVLATLSLKFLCNTNIRSVIAISCGLSIVSRIIMIIILSVLWLFRTLAHTWLILVRNCLQLRSVVNRIYLYWRSHIWIDIFICVNGSHIWSLWLLLTALLFINADITWLLLNFVVRIVTVVLIFCS